MQKLAWRTTAEANTHIMASRDDAAATRASLIDDAAALSDDDNSNDNGSGAENNGNDSNLPIDSSEEEDEDDDEDEMRKVREGFIVDDEDEDEEDEGDEETKTKKKSHRKRARDRGNRPEIDEELDEDDLALLRENAGELPSQVSEKSKFKRLKRGGDDGTESRSPSGLTNMFSDEEAEDEDDEDDRIKSKLSGSARSTGREDTGDNDDDVDIEDDLEDAMKQRQQKIVNQNLAGEFDDFIEDDEFSEDDEDRDEKLARMRSARAKQSQFAQQSKIDQDKLDELYEIFGDGEEYAWALEAEDVADNDDELEKDDELEYDDDGNIIPKAQSSKDSNVLKNIFEFEELKEHLLTDKDQVIRTMDIPERYQVLREGIKNYDLNDSDFVEKQKWVAETLFNEKAEFFADPARNILVEPFKAAVAKIVEFIAKENLEVPTIWNIRKDYTIYTTQNEEGHLSAEKLLNENDLWRIVRLDIDYHAIYEKRKSIEKMFESIDTVDLVYDEHISTATTITDLQDLYDYLQFNYSAELKKAQEQEQEQGSSYSSSEGKKKKTHSRFKLYERVKNDPIYNFVKEIGIDAEKFSENITANSKLYLTDDHEDSPAQLMTKYLSESYFGTMDAALNAVKQMYAQQLVNNPKVRAHFRLNFEKYSNIDIELTEKGRTKINDSSPYADFKYAINRNPTSFYFTPDLFLRMLEAESLGYVIIKIGLSNSLTDFVNHLFTFMSSDGASENSIAWNNFRRECFDVAVKQLVPNIISSVKEKIRNICERLLYFQLRDEFLNKVDQAPYTPFKDRSGMVPRVLALTNGEGKKDSAVIAIAMEFDGTISHHVKFDENIRDAEFERKLLNLIDRFKPEVVGVSGYNVSASHLRKRVEEIVRTNNKKAVADDDDGYDRHDDDDEEEEHKVDKEVDLPVLYIPNETARLFEYSDRANEEFSDKPVVAKFCIGIARYLQNPLLEYISLGDTITSIQIHKHQNLLPEHVLKEAIDTIFVDITCLVGIKINEAVRSPYFAQSLKYVAGLGPRKANNLIKGIEVNGGLLVRRDDLIIKQLVSKVVFLNCAPFIEIPIPEKFDKEHEYLDATRIHPEDYELARKMAGDALDLEDEDRIEAENDTGRGGIIGKLYDEGVDKWDELLLEG